MKVVKTSIVNAINYYNSHTESYTQVAKKFNTGRHVLSKYITSDIHTSDLKYIPEKDYYVLFEQKELDAMKEFVDNPTMSYDAISKKYGFKSTTFQRLCEHNNIPYRDRILKCHFNRQALQTIETEEDAYILGFMLADAYVCEQRHAVRIKLHHRDEDILHKINKYFNSDIEIKHEYHNITGNKLSYLYFSSVELIETLKKYGICRNKSLKEVFYHDMPNNLKKHYIRGIIDGDGFITKDPSTPQIGVCGSYDVVKNIVIYLNQTLNLNLDNDNAVKREGTSNLYRFSIRGQKAISVMKFLYEDSKIYLDRKYELAKRFF